MGVEGKEEGGGGGIFLGLGIWFVAGVVVMVVVSRCGGWR